MPSLEDQRVLDLQCQKLLRLYHNTYILLFCKVYLQNRTGVYDLVQHIPAQYQENSRPENSHPEYSHFLKNIPTRFFKFLYYCHRYHWYYLKNCFVILCFKSQTYCGVKKKELAGQYCYILKKVLLVKYDNRSLLYPPVCFGTFYLGSWGMWCYDASQFNQIDLNSAVSIGLLINWLTCLFIYRSENNCEDLDYCII